MKEPAIAAATYSIGMLRNSMRAFLHRGGRARRAIHTIQATHEAGRIARSNAARLRRVIDSLPLALRETLVLREISGLNYRPR
jgi:DNA-directed RNA polymerase specialized sigma24 family protein